MLWVTRRRIRVNRTATGWLVRFVDPAARFRFIEPAEVAAVERSDRAIGFDAPGARYPHKDGRGRCSFEVLVKEDVVSLLAGPDAPADVPVSPLYASLAEHLALKR